MTDRISVGGRDIGPGAPVYIIAEAGVNHDGDLETALELIEAAARAGADAVKFQTFDPDELVTARSALADYQRERVPDAADQLEMLRRLRFGADEHAALLARCRARQITFLSTPFDSGSGALLAELGVGAFKIGSGELTNLPFLDELAGYGLPLLLSTGMSELTEVRAAVDVVKARGVPLVLLHCTSSYPAPDEDANLRAMDTMRAAFKVPVGYSDHAEGLDLSLAAVARDACVVERHLTLDRRRPGPDHAMSLEPRELEELVRRIRDLEQWLGDGVKRPQPSEQELRVVARRSVVAARDLSAGDTLALADLAVKRPGDGLPPARLRSLIGGRLTRSLAADEALAESDVSPAT